MAKIRFIERTIASLRPPATGQAEYWDKANPGFGLRVSVGGQKSFVVLYRFEGRKRRLTLGSYPVLTLAAARELSRRAMAKVCEGRDPATEKQDARLQGTFKELADLYIERYAQRNKRSWKTDRYILNKNFIPAFGARRATAIRRRDVISVLDEIVARGAPIGANRALEIVRRVYNWAISRDIVEFNPCQGIEPPTPAHERDRVLSQEEIYKLWHGLDQAELGMRRLTALALKFQLVTLSRIGEVVGMMESEIDEAESVWTIPAERAKTGKAHRVALPALALELLTEIRQESDPHSAWLFSSKRRETFITPGSVAHALCRSRDKIGIHDVVPHDLRRTAASHLASMGTPRLTISKMLGHADSGTTKIYDRHGYDAEKRRAAEAWSRRLTEIVTGQPAPKIVELRPGAAAGAGRS